jgi:hypothetical protein
MDYILLRGDARRIPLADRSVHCVATSPPYFSLRDYGTGRWEGGDPACEHRPREGRGVGPDPKSLLGHVAGAPHRGGDPSRCRCGARRVDLQLGLEATPDAYVAALVAVFREVRRVLRDDGTLWLNVGDSYASGQRGDNTGHRIHVGRPKNPALLGNYKANANRNLPPALGYKPKDLIGIPWRLAFALQADGWYLRSEVIWFKPSAMPESVRDRPARNHEQVFLLTKRPRYFYDVDACREPQQTLGRRHEGKSGYRDGHPSKGGISARALHPLGGAVRTVWRIAQTPYKGAHFATMPRTLAARCVRLGTSEKGCCPACGAPWRRLVEKARSATRPARSGKVLAAGDVGTRVVGNRDPGRHTTEVVTVGWHPGCGCDAGDPVPCVVFDPFNGAGTTGLVATALGRRYLGLDLKLDYLALARRRIERPHARPTPAPAPEGDPLPLFDRMGSSLAED